MPEVLEGEVQLRRHDDGRIEILQAPATARMSLELLQASDPATVRVGSNTIGIAGQVRYRVVGWDAQQSALLLEREGPFSPQSP
jgi:hypothetical protein